MSVLVANYACFWRLLLQQRYCYGPFAVGYTLAHFFIKVSTIANYCAYAFIIFYVDCVLFCSDNILILTKFAINSSLFLKFAINSSLFFLLIRQEFSNPVSPLMQLP